MCRMTCAIMLCAASLAQDAYQQDIAAGVALVQSGRYAEAVEPLRRAAGARPGAFEPNYLLGITLAQAGRRVDAIRCLRSAQAANGAHAGALTLLGILYLQEGFPLDAAETLDAAARQGPLPEKAALVLAEAWHAGYQFDRALNAASDAAARYPNSADTQFRWGYELEMAGRFEEAGSAFMRSLQLRPEFAEAHLSLGRQDLRLGRYDSAQQHLESVLRLQPKQRQGRIEMAKLLSATRHYARARELLEALIAENDAEAEPHLLLARACQVIGDSRAARRERARFLELSRTETGSGGMSANLSSRKLRRFDAVN